MTDEQPEQPQQQIEIQLPIVPLAGVNIEIETTPDGGKLLMLGPLVLAVPLGADVAKNLGAALLADGVQVVPAHAIPKMAIPRGGRR